MHGFSTVNGFVEINECLAEMIKYVANEPTVGLYYVQQHTQNAVPNIISLRNNVTDKSHQTKLHTEDLEDSITMVSLMKDRGFPIADEMIGDIMKSLTLINNRSSSSSSSSFHRRTSSWGPTTWQDGGSAVNLFSNVFKSAASNLKWPPQLDPKEFIQVYGEKPVAYARPTSTNTSSSVQDNMEAEEAALSSMEKKKVPDKAISLVSETYGSFKADREAKLYRSG